jgi:hypothetical protein
VPQAVAAWIATYTLTATSVLTYSQIVALTYTAFAAATITYGNHQRRKQQRAARDAFNASVEDRLVMTATAQAARSRVYGRVRNVDGVVFKHTHGANKEFYTLVIALAGHEVDAIEQVWFNDVPVALDAAGFVTTAPWNITQSFGSTLSMTVAGGAGSVTLPPGFQSSVPPQALLEGDEGFSYSVGGTVSNGVFSVSGALFDGVYRVMFQEAYTESRARVRRYTGAPGQNLYNDLTALVGAAVGPSDRFEGFAALLVTLQYDQDAFPTGVPNISAVMRGARVFDPRTSTTAWTENPALIARDWSLHPQGGGCVAAEINEPAFIAAANACDVSTTFALAQGGPTVRPLYQCGIVIPLDANPDEALGELCEAMAGQWGWAGGRLSVRAGVYRAPVATVTEDWVTSVEAIQITPGASTAEAVNVLRPTYADQGQGYVQTPGPEVRAAAYVTADGRELVQELQLGGVTQSVHAQHVCGVLLREAREALTVQLPCNLRAYPLELFDVVSVTLPRFGWAAKLFEVVAWRFSPAGGVLLTLRETAAANYTVAPEFDVLTASPNTGLARPEAPPAITGLAATSGGVAQIDGSSLARIRVTWDPVASEAVRQSGSIELQVAEVYAGLPAGDWPAVPPAAGRAVAADIFGQRIGRLVAIRARAVNTLGMRGPWVQITHQVSGRRAPVVWRQAAAPANASVQDGDEWVDTDDANRRYLRASGAWVDVRDATIATAATTATWTGVSSRPANLAGLGGGEAILNDATRPGAGNQYRNTDFELEPVGHTGPPTWFAHYNNGGYPASHLISAGGPIGNAKVWRITPGVDVFNTWGFLLFADGWTGWRNHLSYVWSFYARAPSGGNIVGAGFFANWNQWPESEEWLENPPLSTDWQRYVLRINFGNEAIDPNGFVSITAPPRAGVPLEFSCIAVEPGLTPSGWAPYQYVHNNRLYGLGTAGSGTEVANAALVPSINSAATTATWSGVSGPGRPADNATVGAPAGTPVGSILAEQVESQTGATAKANAAQSAAESTAAALAAQRLRKDAADVLSGTVSISATAGAGLRVGTLTWDAAGNRTGGSGVAVTPGGIVGHNGTEVTFSFNAATGEVAVRGDISGSSGNFLGNVIVGSGVSYTSGTGAFIGVDGGVAKFRVGSVEEYVRWTGSALEIKQRGAIPTPGSFYATANAFGGWGAIAGIEFRRNGEVYVRQGTTQNLITPELAGQWHDPIGATVGDSFQLRVDIVSGDAYIQGVVVGAWAPMNTTLQIMMTADPPWSFRNGDFAYQIRRASDQRVVSTGMLYLGAYAE